MLLGVSLLKREQTVSVLLWIVVDASPSLATYRLNVQKFYILEIEEIGRRSSKHRDESIPFDEGSKRGETMSVDRGNDDEANDSIASLFEHDI